ncbi:cytochrome c oxidase assembly protein [uncultured Friedmanniella sp.]|uniref:cytochrome c oxidase assembly protein n=1 Tax=uncultured Friedmanniella sp. TaxID=335381 RepID=UPI0035CBF8F4
MTTLRDRPTADQVAPRRPVSAVLVGVVTLLVALTVAVGVLAVTGELASVAASGFDPGAVVRYGLPAARTVHDLAASLTVGLLLTAAWLVAPEPGTRTDRLSGARRATAKLAVGAAAAWLVAGVLVIVLTTADVSGLTLGTPGFDGVVASFVSQVDLGRALLASVLVVAVLINLVILATKVVTVAWAAVLSLVALLPLALAGHAAGSADHMNSVDSLALHLLGVCVWVGGLAALLIMRGRLGSQLPTVAARYSTLAGWCFAVVALSGLVNAALRLGDLAHLATTYGLLVIGKAVALVLLGLAGFGHRRWTLRRIGDDGRWFARLAGVELVVMGAAMGLAVALSRSAPPVPDLADDPVAALLGYPVPPPVTVVRYLTAFHAETLWLAVAAALVGLYLAGVVKLVRRGDRWPLNRTLFWVAGGLALVFVTSGGPGVYGRVHFSSHMLQHMSLMVVVPLLLVFGAPVTLAMRTLTARTDGSFGPRELLLQLVHSRALRVLGHPLVAAGLFTGSLVVFYYSRLFELAMFTHTGHVLMTAHFLLTGYLFVWALVGIDPGPARPPYPLRLVLLLVVLGFHAFFGISLMSSGTLLAPDWWHSIGQTDDAALLVDQQNGGAIAWGAGDIPSLLLGLALLVSWVRSDAAESKRLDRKADRDGDADLRAYNERLDAMTRRDGRG